MRMTFSEYIQNPAGKQNAVFSQREMYRTIYTQKLDKILLRENNKIDYHLYTDSTDFYIYIKIPSETIEKFYYDVVVRFFPNDPTDGAKPTLKSYNVQFFSNSPDFVFTYAHVFIEKDLFIEDLKPKMSKQAIKKEANVRNPEGIVGYVKGLYFAYLIMENRGLFTKSKFKLYSSKYNKKELLHNIEEADIKIEKRQEEEAKKNKKEKKEKSQPSPSSSPQRDNAFRAKPFSTISPIKKINNSSSNKFIKRTSTIKKK